MKIIYLLLIVLVLYTGFVFVRFSYVTSHANLPDIQQPERSAGTGPKLKYIAAGDSTGVGEGASSVEKTYTYQLADYLAQKHSVEYKNVAARGAQTQDVIDTQLAQIIADRPDVVTISIGANDLTHARSNARVIANFKNIIATLTEKTSAKIYITDVAAVDTADLLPWVYRKYLAIQAHKINSELLTLETDRVKFIDIHDFGWSNYPSMSVTFAADRFHPNDEGYNNWTNAFLSKIKQNF